MTVKRSPRIWDYNDPFQREVHRLFDTITRTTEEITQNVSQISVTVTGISGSYVPDTRLINTTAPLSGGGDLTVDRTLSVATFGAANSGVVPLSGGGTANFLRADGTWATPPGTFTATNAQDEAFSELFMLMGG